MSEKQRYFYRIIIRTVVVVFLISIAVMGPVIPSAESIDISREHMLVRAQLDLVSDAVRRFEHAEAREIRSLDELIPRYLKKLKKDRYGNQLYLDTKACEVFSAGADHQPFSKDDIVSSYRKEQYDEQEPQNH